MRMAGHDVLMVSGTDEHGTPIQVQADSEGVTARQTADKYHQVIVEDLQGLGLSYDLFTRTTTRNHYAGRPGAVHARCTATGTWWPKTQMGAISPSTGPHAGRPLHRGRVSLLCGYDGARGDQCDNCGNQLDPIDLKNPRSRIDGEVPQFVETEHFFLDLPALAERARRGWRPGPTGVRTCSGSRSSSPRSCSRARSPATSTGASRSRCRRGSDAR